MRQPVLLLFVALAGCTSTDGAWPSLHSRAGEAAPKLASCGAPVAVGCAGTTVAADARRAAAPAASASPFAAPAMAPAIGSAAAPAVGSAAAPAVGMAAAPAGGISAAPVVALGDVAVRLDTVDRDLADLTVRLGQQRAATDAAVAAARGAKPNSEPWGKAQLELTRLQNAGGRIGDLHDRLNALAGTLAAAAAAGSDVGAPLAATGRLIARTVAADADFRTAFAAARAELSR